MLSFCDSDQVMENFITEVNDKSDPDLSDERHFSLNHFKYSL